MNTTTLTTYEISGITVNVVPTSVHSRYDVLLYDGRGNTYKTIMDTNKSLLFTDAEVRHWLQGIVNHFINLNNTK